MSPHVGLYGEDGEASGMKLEIAQEGPLRATFKGWALR